MIFDAGTNLDEVMDGLADDLDEMQEEISGNMKAMSVMLKRMARLHQALAEKMYERFTEAEVDEIYRSWEDDELLNHTP